MCVCVCVCARARACACACLCMCMYWGIWLISGIKLATLLFETSGAAGKTMLDLTRRVRKQYRAYILDHDDPKAEQVFHSTWMNRISTSLQIGTANMIHNIAMGRRTLYRKTGEGLSYIPCRVQAGQRILNRGNMMTTVGCVSC